MPSQPVELPDHESEFVRRCILDGRYKDASAVVQAGLRLLEQQEEEARQKLERLRAEVQRGMDDLENGRYTEINSEEELDAFMDAIDREAELIVKGERDRVSAAETQ